MRGFSFFFFFFFIILGYFCLIMGLNLEHKTKGRTFLVDNSSNCPWEFVDILHSAKELSFFSNLF